MFIRPTSPFFSFQPTIEFIKQDKLKTVISFIALAILCVSTAYWISSHLWGNRQVKVQSPESEDQDLSPILEETHLRKPKSEEISEDSLKREDLNKDSKEIPLNHPATQELREQQKEITKEIETASTRSNTALQEANLKLQQCIKKARPLAQDPIHSLIELQTHVHQIFENVYLGNLRAYYSVDPKFVESYSMVDSEDNMINSFRIYDEELTYLDAKKLYQVYHEKTKDGCANLNIKHVISVTQFKPKETVPANDWSRFQPDLNGLDISRMQIKVDDDEFAWETITPHFEAIFDKIDQARSNNEALLIHCVEGKSRSVSVLIAYLINRCHVTFEEAVTFIQNIRPQAEPKPSLANALKTYQVLLKLIKLLRNKELKDSG